MEREHRWAFFLAHAAGDLEAAERLYELLSTQCSVFLDSKCLELGDDWDAQLAEAQNSSAITVVLISPRVPRAYYQREEIAAAIALSRRNERTHRVVPIYLPGADTAAACAPYGLRLKQGVSIRNITELAEVAERLLSLYQRYWSDASGSAPTEPPGDSEPLAIKDSNDGPLGERLREYLYVDHERVRMYFDQIEAGFVRRPRPSDVRRVRSPAPFVGTRPEISLSLHHQLETVCTHLRLAGDVAQLREALAYDGSGSRVTLFVEETMVARKVIVPRKHLELVPGLRSIAVWISDPDPSHLSTVPFGSRATFVYLVESFWDAGELATVWSGCSALQAIANVVSGVPGMFLPLIGEPLGRGSAEHPLDKLRILDVQVQPPRRIRSLYRIRYITDEQCFTLEDQEHRVNDLMGYPLYITAE
jgi:hypothetical protein